MGKNKIKLNTYSEEFHDAFVFQRKKTNWTFYDERVFLENAFQSRFNFLTFVYALFVTALFTAQCQNSKLVILILGFIITLLMGWIVFRAYKKLNVAAQILHCLGDEHALPIISEYTSKNVIQTNIIMGAIIPLVTTLSFAAGLILLLTGIFTFE